MSYVQSVWKVWIFFIIIIALVFEITNVRLCKYMVIAHKTIKYSLTKNWFKKCSTIQFCNKVYKVLKNIWFYSSKLMLLCLAFKLLWCSYMYQSVPKTWIANALQPHQNDWSHMNIKYSRVFIWFVSLHSTLYVKQHICVSQITLAVVLSLSLNATRGKRRAISIAQTRQDILGLPFKTLPFATSQNNKYSFF